MSRQDTTQREALLRLGGSTADAVARVLETFAPGAVTRGEVSVHAEGASPFVNLQPGSVAASVSYVDGVTGANIAVLTAAGARKLAQAMGMPAPEDEDTPAEFSELELSAVSEAANQMMAAAASAIGEVLGHEVDISPPDARVLDDPAAAAKIYGSAPHAVSTTFMIGGESCRLIQLVPSAFVVRMVRAIDELSAVQQGSAAGAASTPAGPLGLLEAIGATKLRVWAELGRTRMPLGRALALPLGSVVDLDQAADAPVDVFVNGVRFARGHLVVNEGDWAVCLDELIAADSLADLVMKSPESELEGAIS